MRLEQRSEQGSIIIAMTVMLVVTGLAVAVLARTTSSMSSSRRGQDFNAALGQADAGVSDAIYRLDQLQGTPPTQFCVGNKPGCDTSPLPSASDVEYVVTPVAGDVTKAIVRSKGGSNSVKHGVEAQLQATLKFPFAIFGKSSLTFNGNGDNGTIDTVDANGNPSSLTAYAGSNGPLDCNGGSGSPADAHSSRGSNNCSPQLPFPQDYNPLDPVLDCAAASTTSTPPQPCPRDTSGGQVTPTNCTSIPGATVSGSMLNLPASMVGGVYSCSYGLKFPAGNFTVTSGRVEFFVVPTSGSLNIDFDRAIVNGGAASTADPTKLFVYMAGSGTIDTGNGGNAGEFTGVMYAPTATLTENGCKAKWRGAIVVNQATCNGGPNQSIKYDTRVNAITDGRWKLTYFKQIPSSQVVLP